MTVVTVAFEDLDTWLQNQPANTADTPYELNITGLTANDIRGSGFSGTLGYILQQNYTKYVDLRSTVLPNGVTDLSNAFSRSTSFMLEGKNSPIVYAPEIPTGVTSMASCFSMCNSLISSPTIPNGVTRIDNCFQACNSLIIAPNIPSSVVNMYRCFYQCTSLTTWKQSDVITTTNLNFNSVFFRCTNLVNIQSDRPYEIKNFLNTLYSAGTGNFPNDPDTCNFSLLNEPAEIPISLLSNELSALSANTTSTPYKLNVTELTANDLGQSSTSGTLGYVLTQNDTKYVDLSSTEIPNTVVELRATFKNCTSLVQVFDIPSSVTNMSSCFYRCTSLISAPIIPNSVTYMRECFYDCSSLSTIPNIPNSVTEMSSCFFRCTSLTTAPEIRSSRNMENCFYGCTSLTTAPVILSASSMGNCFRECTSLITVPILPNLGGGGIRNCFYGCSALEEITLCEADLESLVNNNKAENCFYGCTSLTKIGVPPSDQPAESDWHAFRLKFGASTVEGKVYDQTGTAVTIPQTTITKSTLELPIKTDELWFPNGYTDAQIDEIIQKVIQYRYTYWNDNDVLDPAEKNFVLWADEQGNIKSNLKPATAGTADSATKLQTPRILQVALDATTSKSFDGTADVTRIQATGILPVSKGGTGQSSLSSVSVGSATTATRAYRDSGGSWISGRDNCTARQLRQTQSYGSSWNPVIGVKTWAGHWSLGTVGAESLMLSYDTDENYNISNNTSAVINFPSAGSSGTLALTSSTVYGAQHIPTSQPDSANGAIWVV